MIIEEINGSAVTPYVPPLPKPSVNVFGVLVDSYLKLVDRPIILGLFCLACVVIFSNAQGNAPGPLPKLIKDFKEITFKQQKREVPKFLDWLLTFLEKYQVTISYVVLFLTPYFLYFYDRYLIIGLGLVAYSYLLPSKYTEHLIVAQLFYLYSTITNESFRLVFLVLAGIIYIYGLQ